MEENGGNPPPSTKKKKKSAPPPKEAPANVVVEDLGPGEIRIETPVVSEDVPKPKKKKQVGFAVIEDEEEDRRKIRKTVYQSRVTNFSFNFFFYFWNSKK